jgi:uncharacterized protein (DUF2267 family)
MDIDVVVTRVQQRAHLYGPRESRRAVCAVVATLGDLLPAQVFQLLTTHLPAEIRSALPRPDRPVSSCADFLTRIADRLLVDGPNAAFLARAVLEQLNTGGLGLTPAAVANLAPADLRPLLRSRLEENAAGPRVITRRIPAPVTRARRHALIP